MFNYLQLFINKSITFVQKGYDSAFVNEQLEIVKNMERKDLLVTKEKVGSKEGDEFRIVLGYNIQKNKVENIIKKHWNILLRDKVLGGVLPPCPLFVYKKAQSLRNIVAPGVLGPLVRKVF